MRASVSPGAGRHGASHTARLAAIGLLLAATYGPGLDGTFQYDDLHSIVDNPHIRSVASAPSYFTDPLTFSSVGHTGMFRPLVLLSYAVDHAVGEGSPWPYKATNLILHWVTAVALYFLVMAVGGHARTAFVGTVLFALHPINSETVSYISARAESLAWVLGLAALWLYAGGRGRDGNPVWAPVALTGALLSKSVAVVVPVLAALTDLRRPDVVRWRDAASRLLLLITVVALYLAVVRTQLSQALIAAPVRGLAEQLLTQAKAVPYYLRLLAMPTYLSVEHPFVSGRSGLEATPWLGLALVVSVALLLAAGIWRGVAGFSAAWFLAGLLTLAPTAIVPLNVLVNEHRLYALSAMVFVGLVALAPTGRWRLPGVVALVAILSVLSAQRSRVWATPATLWQDAVIKAPDMPRPHLFVGDVHLRAGRHTEALREYEIASKVNPSHLSAGDSLAIFNNTGAAFLAMGENRAAIAAYEEALAIDPTYARSRVSLDALLALESKRWRPAAQKLHRSGLSELVAGHPRVAQGLFRQALEIQPRAEILVGLSLAQERAGDAKAAAATRVRLRRLFPGAPYVPIGVPAVEGDGP